MRISDWSSDVCSSDLERLNTGRRLPPHWLAFQLHRELELADDLSAVSVANMIASLLAELSGRAGLQVPSAPLPWLHSVLEQIEDEFCRPHSLESLAETAGVHPVQDRKSTSMNSSH